MIETREPKEIDSLIRRISTLDSQENNINGISVCVTHSPWNISNSQASLPASCALVDFVKERENLGPVDLMVGLDNINEGGNMNSDKFSPEHILTNLHKLNRAI